MVMHPKRNQNDKTPKKEMKSFSIDALLYDAMSQEPRPEAGHGIPHELMSKQKPVVHGLVGVNTGFNGFVSRRKSPALSDSRKYYKYAGRDYLETDDTRGLEFENPFDMPSPSRLIRSSGGYNIAYTKMCPIDPNPKSPCVIFLHGVPTNRRQWWQVQKLMAYYVPTLSFDMLGMGQSDQPRFYGEPDDIMDQLESGERTTGTGAYQEAWKWKHDLSYIKQLIEKIIPKGKDVVFVADDWGGGQLAHFLTENPIGDRLKAVVFVDPIAFDGYPVSEIQTIGRSSMIQNDEQFKMAMGAFDQTLVQIYKTMVYDNTKVYNQYSLRDIKFPYAAEKYVEVQPGVKSNSLTLGLKWHALRVLADRSAILSSALLLPFHPVKNPEGPRYSNARGDVLVLWGEYDNMMPELQRYRFEYALQNCRVEHKRVHDAGHFAGTDKPKQVAEDILNFIKRTRGLDSMPVFLGFSGIFKGDEMHYANSLQAILDNTRETEIEYRIGNEYSDEEGSDMGNQSIDGVYDHEGDSSGEEQLDTEAPICDTEGCYNVSTLICDDCGLIQYCSEKCQTEDEHIHEEEHDLLEEVGECIDREDLLIGRKHRATRSKGRSRRRRTGGRRKTRKYNHRRKATRRQRKPRRMTNRSEFVQQAKKHGMTTRKFVKHVLKNKSKYDKKTVVRANYIKYLSGYTKK